MIYERKSMPYHPMLHLAQVGENHEHKWYANKCIDHGGNLAGGSHGTQMTVACKFQLKKETTFTRLPIVVTIVQQ
jgi:hypothetical protein